MTLSELLAAAADRMADTLPSLAARHSKGGGFATWAYAIRYVAHENGLSDSAALHWCINWTGGRRGEVDIQCDAIPLYPQFIDCLWLTMLAQLAREEGL